jgi:hypothetical protein
MNKYFILLIQIILFSVVLIVFPTKYRLIVAIIFIPVGIIFLSFKQKLGQFMYQKQIEAVRQKLSVEKYIDGFNHGGILLTVVGLIGLLMVLLLKVI